jgi:hypothetical protein
MCVCVCVCVGLQAASLEFPYFVTMDSEVGGGEDTILVSCCAPEPWWRLGKG